VLQTLLGISDRQSTVLGGLGWDGGVMARGVIFQCALQKRELPDLQAGPGVMACSQQDDKIPWPMPAGSLAAPF